MQGQERPLEIEERALLAGIELAGQHDDLVRTPLGLGVVPVAQARSTARIEDRTGYDQHDIRGADRADAGIANRVRPPYPYAATAGK